MLINNAVLIEYNLMAELKLNSMKLTIKESFYRAKVSYMAQVPYSQNTLTLHLEFK